MIRTPPHYPAKPPRVKEMRYGEEVVCSGCCPGATNAGVSVDHLRKVRPSPPCDLNTHLHQKHDAANLSELGS